MVVLKKKRSAGPAIKIAVIAVIVVVVVGVTVAGVMMAVNRMNRKDSGLKGSVTALGGGGPVGVSPVDGKIPFTLGPETTVISTPLRANGTPDYVAAMNEKYGAGVTPENNGYAMFVAQVAGTESGAIDVGTHDQMLELLGVQRTPAGTEVWQSYMDYLMPTMPDTKARENADDVLVAHGAMLWSEADDPQAAAFIAKQNRLLDLAIEAIKRSKWWIPSVSKSGMFFEVMLPSLGSVRDVGRVLCARAMMRAQAGDFDGFMADVTAAKRLARHMGGTSTLIGNLVGVAINTTADNALGGLVGSGKVTAAQCARIRSLLQEFHDFPPVNECIHMGERWAVLDMAQAIAMKMTGMLAGQANIGDVVQKINAAAGKDPVDWDYVLQKVNAYFDRQDAIMKIESMSEYRQASSTFDSDHEARMEQLKTLMSNPRNMMKQPGESQQAFSDRILMLVEIFIPRLTKAAEIERRMVMLDDFVDVLVAGAQYKLKNGKWPEKLEDVTPEFLAKLPIDLYSGDGRLHYIVKEAGIRVYSVGENGQDDGGVRDSEKKLDDLAVGVRFEPIPGMAMAGPGGGPGAAGGPAAPRTMDEAIAVLKDDGQRNRWAAAVDVINAAAVDPAKRAQVVAALAAALAENAAAEHAATALKKWATVAEMASLHAAVQTVIAKDGSKLGDASAKGLLATARLLITFKDAKAAEIMARLLYSSAVQEEAKKVLLTLVATAEDPLQQVAADAVNTKVAMQALDILAKIGTDKSVPVMQAAAISKDAELAAAGTAALKELGTRLKIAPDQLQFTAFNRYVIDAPAGFGPDNSVTAPNTRQWTHAGAGRAVRSLYGVQVKYVGKDYKMATVPGAAIVAGPLNFQPLEPIGAQPFTETLHVGALDGEYMIEVIAILDTADKPAGTNMNTAIKKIRPKAAN